MKFALLPLVILAAAIGVASSNSSNCNPGFKWNSTSESCTECREDTINNETNKACQSTFPGGAPCMSGYKYNENEKKCEDVDECREGKYPCRQKERCFNKPGTYLCFIECGQGYEYNRTSGTCEDIDECKTNIHNCLRNENCENSKGSFKCIPQCPKQRPHFYSGHCRQCPQGFAMDGRTRRCRDYDECTEGPYRLRCKKFAQKCVKQPVLSKCVHHCSGGTTEKDGVCENIDECTTKTYKCKDNEICMDLYGTYACSKANCGKNAQVNREHNKCACLSGYSYNIFGQCEDINECKTKPDICGKMGGCQNTDGGYKCFCKNGLVFNNITCEDINECDKHPTICGNHGHCQNIYGSYDCICSPGFKKSRRGICEEDIDECVEMADVCHNSTGIDATCVNSIGSYKCLLFECPQDYIKIANSKEFRCELGHSQCMFENEDCFEKLPKFIFYRAIYISNTIIVPKLITSIDLAGIRYDHYFMKIKIQNSKYKKSNIPRDFLKAIFLKRQKNGKTVSVYLTKPIPLQTDSIMSIFLRIQWNMKTYFHSLIEYRIFSDNSLL